jgi:thiosulfate dehydrogenase
MTQDFNNKKKISIIAIIVFMLAVIVVSFYLTTKNKISTLEKYSTRESDKNQNIKIWKAPEESAILPGESGDEIRYGKELIGHTAIYFGPKGKVSSISNGMNCQNCHNQAGTKPFGFNFSEVATSFPQFSKRSESFVTISQRISSCFHRSLNGQCPDTNSKEIKAMIAYMKWVGKDVAKGIEPEDAEALQLKYLDRAADPMKGRTVYFSTCVTCHGKDGQGHLNEQGTEYIFPPLWGPHSYNDGAGLYHLENFASFVKGNMPFGTTYNRPVLTDEQAWDVAAFVNSQPRPHKDQLKDFAIVSDKPIDFPFGPYADNFSEKQHKYGPYPPIIAEENKLALEKNNFKK